MPAVLPGVSGVCFGLEFFDMGFDDLINIFQE
jgi:hypothetical protein